MSQEKGLDGYMLFVQRHDISTLISNQKSLEKCSDQDLIDKYNSAASLGIVGSRGQALNLAAMRKVFMDRFGKSPVTLKDNFLISLTGPADPKDYIKNGSERSDAH